MALVNEHYFQDNASQTGHHPARYRRRYAATSSSLYRSNA